MYHMRISCQLRILHPFVYDHAFPASFIAFSIVLPS